MKTGSLNTDDNIRIREATENDVESIRELFQIAYGDDYAFPRYFDEGYLKEQIFSNDCLMLVAEDRMKRQILGTGSVVFDVGAFTDLIGEFGRLVVHPDCRGCGLGKRIMQERLAQVGKHLHVGLVDNRVEHLFSQKISLSHGFAPVGYLPIHHGEPGALFARHFNDALKLRRNHPHVAPPVHWIADAALRSVGLPSDAIVDDSAKAYPVAGDFKVEEMNTEGYATLLRFERGRMRNRDIFGPVKLHFGSRALQRYNTSYLLAKHDGRLVAAIGYARDTNIDKSVRIFELIYVNEEPIRFLLSHLERLCREQWHVDYVETDVSADAPRMQKTLLELGFLPIAYVPSAVFHYVERLDTVRMARFYVPVDAASSKLVDVMQPIADGVIRGFNRQWIEPILCEKLTRSPVFCGLDHEQRAILANLFHRVRFEAGEWLIHDRSLDGKAYILLSGRAEILVEGRDSADTVGAGEFVGELALLNRAPHSARVRAIGPVEAALINHSELDGLLRERGDIGLIVYRNLARGLAAKLHRAADKPEESRVKMFA